MLALVNGVMICKNTTICWWNGGNILQTWLEMIQHQGISNVVVRRSSAFNSAPDPVISGYLGYLVRGRRLCAEFVGFRWRAMRCVLDVVVTEVHTWLGSAGAQAPCWECRAQPGAQRGQPHFLTYYWRVCACGHVSWGFWTTRRGRI